MTADAARPARAPVDVSLVLIDRTGRVDLEAAEAEAREGVETAVDVVRVAAPYEAVGRQEHRLGTLAVPAGAPWASAVLAGVEAARGEAVVVLDVGLLFRFAGAVALGPELLAGEAGAVAARVLRFDRDRIDFDRGTFSSTRYAVSEHRDHLDRSVARRSRPSLYVDGRAFAVRREALLALAPPAPEFDLVFGDVDLGWRLWLAGSSIVTSERVTVTADERVVVPLGRLPGAMQAAQVHRAGLTLMFQALDEPSLARALAQHAIVHEHALGAPPTDGISVLDVERARALRPGRELAEAALAAPSAMRALVDGLPSLLERRARLQASRRIDDATLFARVGDPFATGVGDPAARAAALLGPRRGGGREQVAVLCADTLGRAMAGPAIRALEIARELAEEFDVVLGVRGAGREVDLPCATVTLTDDSLASLLATSRAVVVQGELTELFPQLLAADLPLAVDLYDPMNLEALEDDDAERVVPYTVRLLVDQVRRGDFFVCASERQRDYWIGMLAGAGRITRERYEEDPDLRRLVDIVPFGIPVEPPRRTGPGVRSVVRGIGDEDPLFVWNGGLWDWFDPDCFIRAIDIARRTRPDVRGYFMGVRHPHGDVERTAAVRRAFALSDELGLTGRHVFFNDWTPYDSRANVYLDATAIVSLHRAHLETRFSFRTRLLDAIWASVPIICTEGDVFADLVREEGIGAIVPAGDAEAAATALLTQADPDGPAVEERRRLAELAHRYTWPRAVEPLRRWLREPVRTGILPRPEPLSSDGTGAGRDELPALVRAARLGRGVVRRVAQHGRR